MLQLASPLPLDIDPCVPGHRPVIVETQGTPAGRYYGGICPSTWHIECVQCRIATAPHISRAVTELRWRDTDSPHRIPLSQLADARLRAYPAAHAA